MDRRFARKPPWGAAVLDRRHPLARGLTHYFLLDEGAGFPRNLAVVGGDADIVDLGDGAQGPFTREGGSEGAGLRNALDAAFQTDYRTRVAPPTIPLSMFALMSQDYAGGTDSRTAFQFCSEPGIASQYLSLGTIKDPDDSWKSKWHVNWNDGVGTSLDYDFYDAPEVEYGTPTALVLTAPTSTGTTHKAWRFRRNSGLVALSQSVWEQGAARAWPSVSLMGDPTEGWVTSWVGTLYLAAVWARALSDAEVLQVCLDPYQVLRRAA